METNNIQEIIVPVCEDIDLITCEDCGIEFDADNSESRDGNTVCPDCADKYHACYDCRTYVHEDISIEVNGHEMCNSCAERYVMCEECGDQDHIDDIYSHDDCFYCSHCYHDKYFNCDHCGEDHERCDSRNATNSRGYSVTICDDCYCDHYCHCDNCSEYIHTDNANSVNYGSYTYCDDCFNERYGSCDSCGDTCDRDDLNYDSDSCEDLCLDCWSAANNTTGSGKILKYNAKPTAQFFGKSDCYLGLELEVDKGKNRSQTANDIAQEFCYFKEDGSLNNGFEIVSHPCSFDYLKGQKDTFKSMFETLAKNGFRSHDTETCGMHIHITKSAFSTWHLYRFLKFFQENKRFIVAVSQRKLEKLERWASLDETTDFSENRIKEKAKCKTTYGDRYLAVNLNNAKTVEIRIFRGTIKLESFYKNIEFVQALFEYTKVTATDKVSVDGFKTFVKADKQYINLHNFITAKGL